MLHTKCNCREVFGVHGVKGFPMFLACEEVLAEEFAQEVPSSCTVQHVSELGEDHVDVASKWAEQ